MLNRFVVWSVSYTHLVFVIESWLRHENHLKKLELDTI